MKNITIDFTAKVFPWTKGNNVYVRGWAYVNDSVLKGERLATCFRQRGAEELKAFLRTIDGCFSVVLILKEEILVAVDHLRSLPVFYQKTDDGWFITDHLSLDNKRYDYDHDAIKQFSYALEVFSNRTIYKNVFQIEAGQIVSLPLSEKKENKEYWWEFKYAENLVTNVEEALDIINTSYEITFEHLIQELDGRTAVIPLSGGHDSRLITYFLTKMGYTKVVAYSYGRKDNEESIIAKQVADYLNIPFYFVEYDRKGIREWAKKELPAYLDYSGNSNSVPLIQEPYAVYHLKNEHLIPLDSVFIPGFSGDFLAGSHLKESFFSNPISPEILKNQISKKHMCENTDCKMGNDVVLEDFLNNIEYISSADRALSPFLFSQLYERFDFMERQVKFIVNGVRAYEYYGYEWLLPEFDRRQFDLWLSIDLRLRLNRSIYYQYEANIYPKQFSRIPFAGSKKKTKKEEMLYMLSCFSIFPWTRSAHYLFAMAPIHEYVFSAFIERNRNINHWVYKKYMQQIKDGLNRKFC